MKESFRRWVKNNINGLKIGYACILMSQGFKNYQRESKIHHFLQYRPSIKKEAI